MGGSGRGSRGPDPPPLLATLYPTPLKNPGSAPVIYVIYGIALALNLYIRQTIHVKALYLYTRATIHIEDRHTDIALALNPYTLGAIHVEYLHHGIVVALNLYTEGRVRKVHMYYNDSYTVPSTCGTPWIRTNDSYTDRYELGHCLKLYTRQYDQYTCV